MLPDDREKLNKVEELKTRLYSKNFKPKIESRDVFIHQTQKEIPVSWTEEGNSGSKLIQKIFMRTSIFKKFFIGSMIFFVLALGFALYQFLAGGNTVSNDNIDISVLGNAFTAGGEELPLQVEITNRNNSALELADLVVEYSKSSSQDVASNTLRIRDSLGTIPAGGVKTDSVKMVIYGEQGSIVPIKISLEYRVENSNAIFVKEKPYSVTINSVPINLSVDAPAEISSNQELTLNVKAILNAAQPATKMLMRIDYPIGFQFESATPAPAIGNNVWNLGDLAPGVEHNISIVGKMVDVFDGEQKIFHIWSGSQSDADNSQIGLVYNSLGYTVLIKKSSIEAKLYINGVYQNEYTSDSRTGISGQIQWVNNLDTEINNLQIVAKITGNALDRKTINANQGFYNSSINSIIWDKSSQSNFATVSPNESGALGFSFSPLSIFSSANGMISNPSINIDVSITGEQPGEGNVIMELNNTESKVIKIISDVGLATKALYYSGPFSNTGPIPPKAEKETTYTITWSISNTANNISNAQVKATLPPWSRFTGLISPDTENLTYNDSTKEIIWKIGSISRGTGITNTGREVSFQIGFNPSLSQFGTQPIIINDAVLTGHDDFANVDVSVNKTSLDTGLSSDSGSLSNGGRVVE